MSGRIKAIPSPEPPDLLWPLPLFESEGGVQVPLFSVPGEDLMDHCVIAYRSGVKCLRKKSGTIKMNEDINCGNCFLHVSRVAEINKKLFVKDTKCVEAYA